LYLTAEPKVILQVCDNRGQAIRSQTTITQNKCTQIKKKTTDGFGYLKQVVIATVVVQSSECQDQSSSMFVGPEIFLLLFIYPVEQQPGFFHLLYRTNIEIRKSGVQSNEWFIWL
jgi:hypothetical protein